MTDHAPIRWLYGAIILGLVLILVGYAGVIYAIADGRAENHALACDGARATYIQDEYVIFRVKQNLTHIPQRNVREAVSFYQALENLIPTHRCDETRTQLKMDAQRIIKQAQEDAQP